MKVRELFDQCALEYDQDRRKLVPCFDDFYGAALAAIPFSADAAIRVLDLGTGTGLFASMVACAMPKASHHLTDVSAGMLDQARRRFAGNAQVSFAVQDHLQLAATVEYDLVISALSIHHLDHPGKQELFRRIFQGLRPGGMFINADQALAPTPPGEDAYESQWLADVAANGVSQAALEGARERMREDNNALLSDQLEWLAMAGFSDVACWYERFRFVVYGGVKH